MKKYFVRMKCDISLADYLTAGKWYKLEDPDTSDLSDISGRIVCDSGEYRLILQKGCAHLGGQDWEVKEINVSVEELPKKSDLVKVVLLSGNDYHGFSHLPDTAFPVEAWGEVKDESGSVKVYYDQLLDIGYNFSYYGSSKISYLIWMSSEVVIKEDSNKAPPVKSPSPRYHHKRTPPPIRKKTDITIHYSNNKKYTIKNVKKLSFVSSKIIGVEYIAGGFERTISIPIKGVNHVNIKSPNKFTLLTVYKNSLSGITKKDEDSRVTWDGNFYEETFK